MNFKTKGYKPRGILRFMKDNCKAVSHKTLSKLSTTPLSNWYLPNEHPKIPILIKTIFIIRLALTKPCFWWTKLKITQSIKLLKLSSPNSREVLMNILEKWIVQEDFILRWKMNKIILLIKSLLLLLKFITKLSMGKACRLLEILKNLALGKLMSAL